MSKHTYPITPAVRVLRENGIEFEPFTYAYEEHGARRSLPDYSAKTNTWSLKPLFCKMKTVRG